MGCRKAGAVSPRGEGQFGSQDWRGSEEVGPGAAEVRADPPWYECGLSLHDCVIKCMVWPSETALSRNGSCFRGTY